MEKNLLLRKTKNFNNIPDELIPTMPEYGKVAVFQYLNMIQDPAAGKNGTPITFYPADHQFAPITKIRLDNGTWASIGMISREDEKGQPVVEGVERSVLSWRPQQRGGYLNITIGHDPIMDAFYQYLMLSPEVADNMLTDSMRDPAVKPMVRYIDYDKQARLQMEAQELKWKAFQKATELTASEQSQLAYILGYKKENTQEQIISAIRQYAETDPKGFFSRVQDPMSAQKSRIAQALDLGIVHVDALDKVVRWADKTNRELMAITSTAHEDILLDYAIKCEDPEFMKTVDALLVREIKKANSQNK